MKENKPIQPTKFKPVELGQELPEMKSNKNVVKISCPSCGTPTEPADINIQDKIAKCGNCASVFSFQKEVAQIIVASETKEKESGVNREVVRPAGIDIDYYKDEMELTMVQPTGGGWIAMAFLTAFFSILLYLVHVKKGIPIYWPAGIASFMVFFIYKQWNSVNEKIFITVDETYLQIRYRPKNFIKDKMIPSNELEQIYIKNIPGSNYYSVYAIVNSLEGQKHQKIVTYVDSRSKARYIEQQIEDHLGIEDRRVPEENTETSGIIISG